MADYKAASTGENSGKTRTIAVGAGQVSVGGTVGGGVFAETTRTIERGTDFVGGRVIKGDLVKGRIIEGDLITGAVGNILLELLSSQQARNCQNML